MRFKTFITENEKYMDKGDLKETLKKIPKAHKKLISQYTYKTQGSNTLKGDDGHIGVNDLYHKKIMIAAPWHYGREFALLHEIGHSVWGKYIQPHKHKQDEWSKIVKNTKAKKVEQDLEELFCHAYANTYAHNKIEIHNHPEWEKFVKTI